MVDGPPSAGSPPGFVDREPAVAAALLGALRDTDAESYAQVCEALADFDVTDRLAEITTPVLAIAGAEDIPTPPESLARSPPGSRTGGWSCSTASATSRLPRRPTGSPS